LLYRLSYRGFTGVIKAFGRKLPPNCHRQGGEKDSIRYLVRKSFYAVQPSLIGLSGEADMNRQARSVAAADP
jgi:hypothetical protein